MSAPGSRAQPVDLKAAMDSASRLRWAAAHSSELVRAAEEFDAACEAVNALVEALKETRTDLSVLRSNVLCAEAYDPRWEGMSSIIRQWIERNDAALKAAGVATEGGLEESL